MFRYSKVINQYEFPPHEVLHQRLITLRLKHRKRCSHPTFCLSM